MPTNNIIQKGRCMNFGECQKANAREVIGINIGEEFICPTCKKPLLKVQDKNNKLLISIITAIILAVGGGIAGYMHFAQPTNLDNDRTDSIAIDTVAQNRPLAIDSTKTGKTVVDTLPPPLPPDTTIIPEGNIDLGYAVWTGTIKDGKPDGSNGRMVFKQRHRIDPRDDLKRFAEAGDYIVGEYMNGKLVQGQWHKKDGNIEFISIGQ